MSVNITIQGHEVCIVSHNPHFSSNEHSQNLCCALHVCASHLCLAAATYSPSLCEGVLGSHAWTVFAVQYLSRPFVVGDRIDVMTSSGGKVVSGFVEEVSPMRTHLRTDHWLSVMIPNKVPSKFPSEHLCSDHAHNG